jgi:class 3 adenylate cyclase
MGDTLLTIARYVPARVVNRLVVDPRPPTRPFEERFPAAVLFADITGFNTLAENLARCGPNGAEELAKVLNDYFGRLIDIISAHGGEVVKFAGDAVLTRALSKQWQGEFCRCSIDVVGGKLVASTMSSAFDTTQVRRRKRANQ